MTLSTTASRTSASGNGSTTTFAFSFKIWAASNLQVYLRDTTSLQDTLQVLNTDYTVDIVSYPNTGNVVFTTAPASGKTVVIVRVMPLTQELDLTASGDFAAENIETQLDKLAAEIQTLREIIARAPRLPIGTSLADLEIPQFAAADAGSVLAVNSTGDGWVIQANTVASASVSAFMATVLDDTTAGAALTTLGFSTFFKTLIDDATAAALFTTLGYLKGSATINFASVADNATSAASTITVTGAVVGDLVIVSASGDIMTTAGVFLFGKVTAADTVSVFLHNDSGGAFDAASQTVNAVVIPKSLFGL